MVMVMELNDTSPDDPHDEMYWNSIMMKSWWMMDLIDVPTVRNAMSIGMEMVWCDGHRPSPSHVQGTDIDEVAWFSFIPCLGSDGFVMKMIR